MKPASKSLESRRTAGDPTALVSRYDTDKCRECGEPIKAGKHIWWVRGVGTAHLTCGWTLDNGKVHPGTKSSIRDIPPAVVKVSVVEAEPHRLARQD